MFQCVLVRRPRGSINPRARGSITPAYAAVSPPCTRQYQ